MLISLDSPQSGFKDLRFRKGLNIILADRASAESAADEPDKLRLRSRNGAGKSSIFDIVHFILGGKPEGALQSSALAGWSFLLTLDVGQEVCTAQRSLSEQKHVLLKEGESAAEQWSKLSIANWSQRLGRTWFGLASNSGGGSASYRQMISYFARRRRDGGYDDPTRFFRNQNAASVETNLAHLFGLDASIVRNLHAAKARLKQLRAAQKAIADLDKSAPAGTKRVDLEAQIAAQIAAVASSRDRLRARVESFNVLPAFREIETELATLNQEFRDLSDQDVLDREAIEVAERALDAEAVPDDPDLERLFSDARVVLPELVLRRYEEVREFHRRLVENRREHLQNEVTSAWIRGATT
jgi:uncharacterized protein YydD (DUF2326 family)